MPRVSAIDPEKIFAGESYVLLQNNGVVLHGVVQPQGAEVLIVDGTAKMSIKASDIAYQAKAKIDLYNYQVRNTVRMGDGEHLKLAYWCMENGLLDQSGVHYEAIKDRIPNSPKFKQLEFQLRQKLLEDPETRRIFGVAPKSEKQKTESSKDVQTASATQPELAVTAPVAVEFREGILPLMRNRCGQSGCHGVQSPTPLMFPSANAMAPSVLQKSLHSAIGYVSKSSPQESPLLKMAMKVHSTQSKPSFDVGNANDAEHLNRIEHWIRLVVSQENVQPATSTMPSMVRNSVSVQPRMPPKSSYQPKIEDPSAVLTLVPGGKIVNESTEAIEPKELKRLDEAIRKLEQTERGRQPQDPFDPEQFNRQFQRPGSAPR